MKRSASYRKWRWARSVCLAATMGLTVAYAASPWSEWRLQTPWALVGVGSGGLVATWIPKDGADWTEWRSLGSARTRFEMGWWFGYWTLFGTVKSVFVPLWVPLLTVALPTAYAWHRCRRRPAGHCPTCGYDLAGIAAVCPECGKAS
jgi:hypothetical protein